MSPRERVAAAFRNEAVDRPPVSYWQHFPGRDHTAALLAEATVAFQRRHDLDLVKLMPTGMYAVQDYGVQVQPSGDETGTTRFLAGPVQRPDDLALLPRVSPERGELARQVEVVRRVRGALGAAPPLIQTIFSPLTMLAKLLGRTPDPAFLAAEVAVRQALERLAGDAIAFGQACLDAGADGVLFATQLATTAPGSREVYERLGIPYDVTVLEALRPRSWAIVLHLHGPDPLFSLADAYPVDAVSWEDRETSPSLAEAWHHTGRCLVGGVGRIDPLGRGTPAAVAAQVREAIGLTGGRRLIVAPGCVVPITTPEGNLRALRSAVV
jgi:uroporphyrinogen decarboxylase